MVHRGGKTKAGQPPALNHASRTTLCDDRVQAEDGDRGSETNLRAPLAGRRVPARLDQGALRVTAVSLSGSGEDNDGSDLGLPELQPHTLVQLTTQAQFRSRTDLKPRASDHHRPSRQPPNLMRSALRQNAISSQLPDGTFTNSYSSKTGERPVCPRITPGEVTGLGPARIWLSTKPTRTCTAPQPAAALTTAAWPTRSPLNFVPLP